MNTALEAAHRIDPALWMQDVLGKTPHAWQKKFLLQPLGSSIAVLTTRQVGKTTGAAVAMAHHAFFNPGSLSVVACPTQNQSAEALRKVRDMVLRAGAELRTDNVYTLELTNGARVLARADTEDSIRGLTVDGWIVADEAARVKPSLMAALHPMRTQRPNARFAMLSTAWSRTDPFWSVWEDESWTRIRATIDVEPNLITPEALETARLLLSADDFKREYLGVPAGAQVSPFTSELYKRATPVHRNMWDFFRPHIIAHDVGHTNDRSTAVIGGPSPLAPGLIGVSKFEELPQGLAGHARVEALAMHDRDCGYKSLIIADLSYDPSYAELLLERIGGQRIIGIQITSSGDTIDHWEPWYLKHGAIRVYKVPRSLLLNALLLDMERDVFRIRADANSLRAYEQLMRLEIEFKQNRMIYKCPPGHHDDLAISWAILAWAARHPHLGLWTRVLEPRPVWRKRPPVSANGWT